MKKFVLFLCTLFLLSACKENENIVQYDQGNSYVYFAYPNPNRRAIERYADSIYYGFALDPDIQVKEKTIAIPIRISGSAKGADRSYNLVIEDSSRFDVNAVKFSKAVISADRYLDTLYISLQRTAKMLSEQTVLYLSLKGNDEFIPGNLHNQKLTVIVDDILNEPKWWSTWKNYFGPYHKEVFQRWIQIYYLGADPSSELITNAPGPIYYWNNMPASPVPSWYPITFNYIEVLKQYLLDNEVYPDGDSTKERILLP
ncbi:DUF4843 domain-containing protein [Sphingobacterium detergens]|uniref:Uncharacterized protein DUF4843 n=1 Tax=Sphingobacterium detergens TaxID=1145106 RepID=A0A420ADI7_SPHD1|nr:DUF4843 domain-containing protein [Sphingobacterium detergens]RKE42511.1 uncharacterized protein DUF4843 [Sphingobacterium detergens]